MTWKHSLACAALALIAAPAVACDGPALLVKVSGLKNRTAEVRVRAFGGEPVERLSRAAEVVLARDNPTSGPERERSIVGARVLAAAAQANGAWGNPSRAIAYGNEALALARLLNDRDAILEALGAWAVAAVFSGMPAKAFSVTTEALELANERNDPWTTGMVRLGRALTFFGAGDMTAALHEVELANEQADRSGNPFVIAFAALTRGRTAGFLREPERARDAFRQAADIYRELGDRRFELVARSDLGHALRRSGELTEAESIYRDVIGDWYRLGNRSAVANQLESFAFIALARTEARRAARLLGAAQQVRSSTGAQMLPFEVIEYDESMASLRAALDESTLSEEWAAGAQLTVEQAIALAVSEAG